MAADTMNNPGTPDRARILASVREARKRIEQPMPYPDYPANVATSAARLPGEADPVAVFRERMAEAGGRCFDNVEALAEALLHGPGRLGYCEPGLLPRLAGLADAGLTLERDFDRARADDYAFAITTAQAAIAETGTLVITDAGSPNRLATVAPWIHVAVLNPERILGSLADGIAALPDDPNVVFVTGSSCTADVEGILIRGAHGPAEQYCLFAGPGS
jgi:L-lactate dehydrogenase complex protein LldG